MARDWESSLRTWKDPPSNTEDQKRDRTEEQIRRALRISQALKAADLQVYAKGSYKNNTNVRLDYDVDIAAECTAFYFYDQVEDAEGLDPSMVGVTPYSGNTDTETFIQDVEAALVTEFGRRAVTRGKIAFRVRESRLTLPADVVPCFSYRLIYGRNLDGSPRYQPGHCVFPQGENRIENYPQQQYDNGVAKNNQTGYRYKHLVRILKRLENELVDHGLVGKLPSYLLECLVFNVPPSAFGYPNYTDDLRAVLAQIFNETLNDQACQQWEEVNKIKYLFHPTQGWTREDAHKLAGEAWDYVRFRVATVISRTRIQAIITLAVIAWGALLLAQGTALNATLLRPYSLVVGGVVVALGLYERWLWRVWAAMRLPGGPPVLRGTWAGTLVSTFVNPATGLRIDPIPIFAAIDQTASTVSVRLLTAESSSRSLACSLDTSSSVPELTLTYLNTPQLLLQDQSRIHHGAMVLEVHGRPVRRLEGRYWTDRDTKGQVVLERRTPTIHPNWLAAQNDPRLANVGTDLKG